MAIAYDPNKTDQDNPDQKNGQQSSGQASTVINPGNSTSTGSSNSSGSAPGSPKPTSSGRFTNISNYLDANKNFNQQGGGLAGSIVGNVQNQNTNLNNNIQQAQTNFNDQSQQGRNQFDQALINNAVTNPTQITSDQNKVQQFSNMRDNSYKGPTSINEAPQLQQQAQNLQDTSSQLGTEAGRYNVLRSMFNRPTYNNGQQRLDNLIIQNDPNQTNQLKNAQLVGNTAKNSVEQANTQAQGQAQGYQNEANNTKSQIQNSLNSAFTQQQTDLQNRLNSAQNLTGAIKTDLTDPMTLNGNKVLSQDAAKRIGLNQSLSQLYGIDPSNYLSTITPTLQNVANADDYSKYQALSQLANIDPTLLVDNSQASKFNTSNPFDINGFLNAVNTQKNAYNSKFDPLSNQLRQTTNDMDYKSVEALDNLNNSLAQRGISLSDYLKQNPNATYDNIKALSTGTIQPGIKSINPSTLVNLPGNSQMGYDAYYDMLNKANKGDYSKLVPSQYGNLFNQIESSTQGNLQGQAANQQAQIDALNRLYGIGKGLQIASPSDQPIDANVNPGSTIIGNRPPGVTDVPSVLPEVPINNPAQPSVGPIISGRPADSDISAPAPTVVPAPKIVAPVPQTDISKLIAKLSPIISNKPPGVV